MTSCRPVTCRTNVGGGGIHLVIELGMGSCPDQNRTKLSHVMSLGSLTKDGYAAWLLAASLPPSHLHDEYWGWWNSSCDWVVGMRSCTDQNPTKFSDVIKISKIFKISSKFSDVIKISSNFHRNFQTISLGSLTKDGWGRVPRLGGGQEDVYDGIRCNQRGRRPEPVSHIWRDMDMRVQGGGVQRTKFWKTNIGGVNIWSFWFKKLLGQKNRINPRKSNKILKIGRNRSKS